jgi:hypothetical protein
MCQTVLGYDQLLKSNKACIAEMLAGVFRRCGETRVHQMSFELEDFTRGFVAALVEAERSSIQPKNPAQRQAFYRVWKMIDGKAAEATGDSANRDWLKKVVRIRNRMSPGQSGAFDQFETALRDLQLSITESPNPSYEDISFTASKPFAISVLNQLEQTERELVREAARLFIADPASNNVDPAS